MNADSPEGSPKSKLNNCICVISARMLYWNSGQPPGKLRASAAAARLSEATSSHSRSSSRFQVEPTASCDAVCCERTASSPVTLIRSSSGRSALRMTEAVISLLTEAIGTGTSAATASSVSFRLPT